MIQDLHFIRPLWLWALLPCAALLLWFYWRKQYKGQWSGYVRPQLWQHVLTEAGAGKRLWSVSLPALAALLAIVALAGPSWERLPQPVFRNQAALIMALDLSASMNSQDIKPSRLQRARHKLLDILERRKEGQTALIVFAGDAFTVTPLTDDVNTIRAQVPTLETRLMPTQGGRADRALEKAIALFAQGGVQHGHVLLITDHADPALLEAARDSLLDAGHRLSILGVGTTEGAPIPVTGGGFFKDKNGAIVVPKLNENELRLLAPYRRIGIDDRDINYLLPDANPQLFADENRKTGLETDIWRDEGPWLLLPLLLLSALAFRRGILFLACLLILPYTQPAEAFGWKDLWLNDNQRAQRAFEAQQYDDAARLFDDAQWRAASAYRRSDYQQAVDALADIDSTDALYNRGNALAQLDRIEEAITSYNRVLELNPEHKDALHNRDLLLQQQPSSNQSNSAQDQKSGDNQQSQDSGADEQSSESAAQDNPSSQSEQTKDDKTQQNQQQQAGEKPVEPENPQDQKSAQAANDVQSPEGEPSEEQKNMEQWLRRVPDDPGGLLREKFQRQHQQQKQKPESNPW